ncbi:MAG TPA: Mur ligase family protein, partial [Candidatus Berkiella sp.]|nr:Mur ligase family protein [Candidatus Berkiella sp.]
EKFSEQWRKLIHNRRVITFGLKNPADVFAKNIELLPFEVRFDLYLGSAHQTVTIGIPGQHTVMNALTCAAAGFALGISLPNIVKGL